MLTALEKFKAMKPKAHYPENTRAIVDPSDFCRACAGPDKSKASCELCYGSGLRTIIFRDPE